MSRSLAPSPTATVCSSGMPWSAANRSRARALPARSTISPTRPPVSFPSATSRVLAAAKSSPRASAERVGDLGEAAADDPAAEAQPLQRADQRARARGELQGLPHLVEDPDRQPGQRRDPGAQRLGEVQLAVHRRRGDPGDLGGPAGPRGQLVDHLAAHQRRVDVQHDQPLAAPGQARPAPRRCRRRWRPRPRPAPCAARWTRRRRRSARSWSPGSRTAGGWRRCCRRCRRSRGRHRRRRPAAPGGRARSRGAAGRAGAARGRVRGRLDPDVHAGGGRRRPRRAALSRASRAGSSSRPPAGAATTTPSTSWPWTTTCSTSSTSTAGAPSDGEGGEQPAVTPGRSAR